MYSHILVPIDGSGPSLRGLEEAVKMATSLNSHLRLLHIVAEHVLDDEYCIGTHAGQMVGDLRAGGQEVVRAAEALLRRAQVKTDTVLEEFASRSAAEAILEHAKKWPANLIVMGTHGRQGVRRLAMGSAAESVLRNASLPILLVRGAA